MKKVLKIGALCTLLLTSGLNLTSCNEEKGPKPIDFQIADFYQGELTDKNTFKVKEGVDPVVTVQGTYLIGGDGNYWAHGNGKQGMNGYVKLNNGVYMYLHQLSADVTAEDALRDVRTGAELIITGTLGAYNGLPQITNYTYKVVKAAPEITDPSLDALFEDYTDKIELISTDASAKATSKEHVLKGVKLTNMVNVTPITDGTTSLKFVPLSYVNNYLKADVAQSEKDKHTVLVYRPKFDTEIKPGNVFDIYGGVTAYGGQPQLNMGNISLTNNDMFKALNAKPVETLDESTKATLTFLRLNLTAKENFGGWKVTKTLTDPETEGQPDNITYEALAPKIRWYASDIADLSAKITGVKLVMADDKAPVFDFDTHFKFDATNPDVLVSVEMKVEELATYFQTNTKATSLDFKVQVSYKIGDGEEKMQESSPISLPLNVVDQRSRKTFDYAIETTTEAIDSVGVTYITNDTKYPNPSFDSVKENDDVVAKYLRLYSDAGLNITVSDKYEVKKSEFESMTITSAFAKSNKVTDENAKLTASYTLSILDDKNNKIGTATAVYEATAKDVPGSLTKTTVELKVTEVKWEEGVTDETLIKTVQIRASYDSNLIYRVGFSSFSLAKKAA